MKIIKDLRIATIGIFAMSINMSFGALTEEQLNELKTISVAVTEELEAGNFSEKTIMLIAENIFIKRKWGNCPEDDTMLANAIYHLLILNCDLQKLKECASNEIVEIYKGLKNKEFEKFGEKLEFLRQPSKKPNKINLRFCLRAISASSERQEFITTVTTIMSQNFYINELDLSSNYIEDKEAERIADALKNSSLHILNLSDNSIGNSGVIALSDALKVNSFLRDLNLSDNSIGNSGIIALSDALKVNSSLRDLNLNGNFLIEWQGMKALSEALIVNTELFYLHLAHCDWSISYLADALKKNGTLKYLDLSENQISSAALKDLTDALKVNDSLVCLVLRRCGIKLYSAKYIANLLKINKTLLCVDLCSNHIDDNEVGYFVDALKNNKTLFYLGLLENPITEKYKKAIADVLEDKKDKNGKIIEKGNYIITKHFFEYYNYYNDLKSQLGE